MRSERAALQLEAQTHFDVRAKLVRVSPALALEIVSRDRLDDHATANASGVLLHRRCCDEPFATLELAADVAGGAHGRRTRSVLFDHALAVRTAVEHGHHLDSELLAKRTLHVVVEVVAVDGDVEQAESLLAVLHAVRHVLHARAEQLAEQDDGVARAVERHLVAKVGDERLFLLAEHLPERRARALRRHFLEPGIVRADHGLPAGFIAALVVDENRAEATVLAVQLFGEHHFHAVRDRFREIAQILDLGVAVEEQVVGQAVFAQQFRRGVPLGHTEVLREVRPHRPVEVIAEGRVDLGDDAERSDAPHASSAHSSTRWHDAVGAGRKRAEIPPNVEPSGRKIVRSVCQLRRQYRIRWEEDAALADFEVRLSTFGVEADAGLPAFDGGDNHAVGTGMSLDFVDRTHFHDQFAHSLLHVEFSGVSLVKNRRGDAMRSPGDAWHLRYVVLDTTDKSHPTTEVALSGGSWMAIY